MAVRQRGNGWQADACYKGHRAREQFTSEKQARAWEALAVEALKKGKPVPEVNAALLDGRTIQMVYNAAEKLHWANLKDTASPLNARTFVAWAGPSVAPEAALSADNVEAFVSDHLMDERQVSNATVNRYLSAIGVLVRFAKLEVKPNVDHLWRKEGAGRIRFYSAEEEAMILQTWRLWSRHLEADFFTFLVDTGVRPFKEGAAVPWQDFAHRKVTLWDTKNNKPRTVPITARSWEVIERHRSNGLKGPFAAIDKDAVDKLYARTRVHLPALEDTVLYTARHTCCSRLVQGGADLMRVKEWMGHKRIETTMRYAHLSPKHLMDIAHLLEPPEPPKPKLVVSND